MQFPYVHVCAILSNDRINDGAVKTLITKEAQERDVFKDLQSAIVLKLHAELKVSFPAYLKVFREASAFERIGLLCFLYFCDGKLTGLRI